MSNRRTAQRGWCVCLTASMIVFTGLAAACGADNATPAPQGLGPDADNSTSVVHQRSNATVKIMPLGDSITESNTGQFSYRYYLWHLLLAKGYRIDFVGSRYGVGNGPPANPDFDMDHEGHAGWKADEILAQIQVWAMEASPDIVLLHIGHNDLCRGQSVTSTVSDIGGIIDVLRTVNPHVRVLLAQVIASASTCHTGIPALNASLPALVADKDRPESPLTLVDQYSGFDPSTMTYDGTHPNAVGDARMADRWFEKLTPVLDTLLTETEKVRFEPTVRVAQTGPIPGGFPLLCLSFGSVYSPHPEVF
jgi:acyl-CoA thioesterase I